MTSRLAPHADEAALIDKRMAFIAREVRRGCRSFRVRPGWTMPLGEMLARLGAVGTSGLSGLPHYFELQSGLVGLPGKPQEKAQENVTRETSPARAMPAFGGYRDCARACGVTERWMAHEIDRLLREEAFPPPREGEGHRKWNLALVAAWAADPANDDVLKRARAAHAKKETA